MSVFEYDGFSVPIPDIRDCATASFVYVSVSIRYSHNLPPCYFNYTPFTLIGTLTTSLNIDYILNLVLSCINIILLHNNVKGVEIYDTI